MKPQDRKKLLARDEEVCWHCGTTEGLTVQHRVNRGMGGSNRRDNPANLILLCWFVNFEMEASSRAAKSARLAGWKCDRGAVPELTPVYHYPTNSWYLLDNGWKRRVIPR
jgi:hypothetical protein